MIYKEVCDAEDWSNDVEKSALPHRNNNYIILLFYCILYQLNAALVSLILSNNVNKIVPIPNFCMVYSIILCCALLCTLGYRIFQLWKNKRVSQSFKTDHAERFEG